MVGALCNSGSGESGWLQETKSQSGPTECEDMCTHKLEGGGERGGREVREEGGR